MPLHTGERGSDLVGAYCRTSSFASLLHTAAHYRQRHGGGGDALSMIPAGPQPPTRTSSPQTITTHIAPSKACLPVSPVPFKPGLSPSVVSLPPCNQNAFAPSECLRSWMCYLSTSCVRCYEELTSTYVFCLPGAACSV